MRAETWRLARSLFEEALELEPDQREGFLVERCPDDEARDEVRRLLAAHDSRSDRFEAPLRPRRGTFGDAGCDVGGFRLVEPIGSGGMGAVWEAEQLSPQRRVAVKLLRLGLGGTDARRRFSDEAELLARLKHPAVAQVFGAGTIELDGYEQPWIALELVDDARDLVRYAQEERLDVRARLELVARVADGVQHAHERGVLHRDLKPENVLVGRDGAPKVIDFGVAKAVDAGEADHDTTRAGQLIGTLRTMSPEQVTGDPDAVDTRTDVYGLGATAYEVLCGAPLYELSGLSVTAALRHLDDHSPRRPRAVRPELPVDVENCLLRALDRDPSRRYASAGAFAEDLRRFLRHEPVTASPPSLVHQLALLSRRHRLAAGVASVALVLVLVALVATAVFWLRAEAEVEKSEAVNDYFATVLGLGSPNELGREATVVEALERTAPHIDTDFAPWPDVRYSLHASIGVTLDELGRPGAARHHLERAVELADEVFGPDSPDALIERVNLGVHLLDGSDDAAAAIEWLEPVAARAIDALGRAHLVSLKARCALARAREAGGEREAAIEELRAILAEYGESATSDPLFAAKASGSLAAVLHRRGELEEAESRYRSAIELLRDESPSLALVARTSLAALVYQRGRTEEGRALQRETVEEMREVLGPADDRTTEAALGLAQMELGFGDPAAARAVIESLEAARRAAGRDGGLRSADLALMLASVLLEEGRPAEASEEIAEAVRIRTEELGPGHPSTLAARHNAAMIDLSNGRVREGARRLEDLLATKLEVLGAEDPSTIATRQALGEALHGLGEYDRALACFEQAHDGYREVLGSRDALTLTSRLCAASVVLDLGDFAYAEEEFRAILDAVRDASAGQGALVAASAWEGLVQALEAGGRDHEASEARSLAAEAAARLSPEHPVRRRIEAYVGR